MTGKKKGTRKPFSGCFTHFFYRQLDISSEPGVSDEILESEPKSCLTVA